jgi:hypothetical protein
MKKELMGGKYTYRASNLGKRSVKMTANSQMVAARKLKRVMKLPPVWKLELMDGKSAVEWWEFNNDAEVVLPTP